MSTLPRQEQATFYRPEIDVLRFFAFFLVFLHHSFPHDLKTYASHHSLLASRIIVSLVEGCASGLCLFFFISAYLITEILRREKQLTGTVNIKNFYQRRILRIWPLYFFGIGIGATYACLNHINFDYMQFIMFALMLGNLYIMQMGWTFNPMEPLWSISIEEQFYLLWPLINRSCPEKILAPFCWLVLTVGFCTLLYYGFNPPRHPDSVVWTDSRVQFIMFAGGALLALRLRGQAPVMSSGKRWLFFLCGLAAWFTANYACNTKGTGQPGNALGFVSGYFLIMAGCLFFVLTVLGIQGGIPRPLLYLGRISFGLYVYHGLVIRLFYHHWLGWELFAYGKPQGLAITFTATLLLAAASYHFLERPLLKIKERLAPIKTIPL